MEKYKRFAANPYQQKFNAVLDELDRQVGRVLDGARQLGLADNTIVALTGDNGPTAWPYYYKEGFAPPGSSGGFRGRKWSLYEGGIREPLLVRWKGTMPAGVVDESTIVGAVDMFPTLCAPGRHQTAAGRVRRRGPGRGISRQTEAALPAAVLGIRQERRSIRGRG